MCAVDHCSLADNLWILVLKFIWIAAVLFFLWHVHALTSFVSCRSAEFFNSIVLRMLLQIKQMHRPSTHALFSTLCRLHIDRDSGHHFQSYRNHINK